VKQNLPWEIIVAHLVKKFSGLVYTSVTKSPPSDHILKQMNTAHNYPPIFSKINFNIILRPTPRSCKWSHPFTLSNLNGACVSHLLYPYKILQAYLKHLISYRQKAKPTRMYDINLAFLTKCLTCILSVLFWKKISFNHCICKYDLETSLTSFA